MIDQSSFENVPNNKFILHNLTLELKIDYKYNQKNDPNRFWIVFILWTIKSSRHLCPIN